MRMPKPDLNQAELELLQRCKAAEEICDGLFAYDYGLTEALIARGFLEGRERFDDLQVRLTELGREALG